MIHSCTGGEPHSLIVARWDKSDKREVADLFICQICARIFEWDQLVTEDADRRVTELKEKTDALETIKRLGARNEG